MAVCCAAAIAQTQQVTVFAAASLKDALDAQLAAFEKQSGVRVRSAYAASNALAKQIEHGAPASLFISADEAWMDYLATRKLITTTSRRNLLSNELVLIAPKKSAVAPMDLAAPDVAATRVTLARMLGGGRMAIANPAATPAGRYAQQAFTKLGLWESVRARLAPADHVRNALAFVARGEAPLGVVYRTDAMAEPSVQIIARLPATSHQPIVYPIAIVTTHDSSDARALLDFLASDAAMKVWRNFGFEAAATR